VRPATKEVSVFRTGPAPKLGDAVVAFGYPLPGLLSSEGNVSTGILSALSGLQNDVRFVQISAPVQPGNSGGPLFDSSGHVIGVIVAKLDAVRVAELTGDIPQNVNFAVNWAEVRAFLDDAGVPYQKEISQRSSTTSSIAAAASRIAVAIECTSDGTESSQPQESRLQDGQAAGPSLQDTISWMQDFSSAHGEKFFDGKPTAKNVLLPDPLHQRPSSEGCAVWATHDYYGVKPGAVSAQVEFFNLSDINPDSVKPDEHSNVQFETSNSSPKIDTIDGLDPSITSANLFTPEVLAGGHAPEGLSWMDWLSFDSPEGAQRFANALKHAVILCGGVKSPF
jgi:hypothetical protein